MAEPEELDEDLFADLYDTEEPAARGEDVIQAIPSAPEKPQSAPPDTDADMTAGDGGDAGDNQFQVAVDDGAHDQGQHAAQMNDAPVDHGYKSPAAAAEHTGINIKEDGKMFIGGLNWETTDESLRRHFEEFGEVAECTVMRDAATGRSRGFGFLTFKDPKTVNTVMVKEHFLDGKIIDPKRAIPRDEQERTSKIFVGGVSQEATEEDFKNYFTQYGRVIDATLMIDKDTKRPRGFGFVTFDSEAAVEATLRGDLTILGKPIEVKRAQPRGAVKEDDNPALHAASGRGRGRAQMQGDNAPQGGAMGYGNGMTPQMMAQYFQRMQQYFAQMMSNMGGNSMMMNPAMMQQMQQMQQRMQQGGQGMTPQMQQQMQQMQQMQMQQMQNQQGNGQGSNGGQGNMGGDSGHSNVNGVPTGPAADHSGRGNDSRQQQGNMGFQQQGGQTSWEGMYDDVPPPNMGGGGGMGGGGPRGRGGQGYGRGRPPTRGPSGAPANAPTGPKNAGVPGANYRGGGRGNHFRGGYHPYRR